MLHVQLSGGKVVRCSVHALDLVKLTFASVYASLAGETDEFSMCDS